MKLRAKDGQIWREELKYKTFLLQRCQPKRVFAAGKLLLVQ